MVIIDTFRKKAKKKEAKYLDKFKKYERISNIKYMELDKPYSILAPWMKIYSTNFLKENNISFEEVYSYEDMQFFIN